MSPEEAKKLSEKYTALAVLFAAKAAGKELQISWMHTFNGTTFPVWYTTSDVPTIESDLSRWRIKPEPRRMWTTEENHLVRPVMHSADADKLRDYGYTVTEWQEVLK